MSTDLPIRLRQIIMNRAGNCCEYCLLPQSMSFHKHEPDHIIPIQHGGEKIE